MLKVIAVSKTYADRPILRAVSLLISPGERVGLVGPNGCGKTTLLRIIQGQERPDAGQVQLAPGLRVGYLAQGLEAPAGATLSDCLTAALGDPAALEAEMARLAAALAERPADAALHEAYDAALARLAGLDAGAAGRVETTLTPGEYGGNMDCIETAEGTILYLPVWVRGGYLSFGDVHALQGDGEIAGHTCDVSGTVTLQVHVLKNLSIDGPILLPVAEDLPFLAKPLNAEEKARALAIARQWGLEALEESAPISVIGTGPDLNAATDNGLERAARLLEMSVPEVKNRATITGAIEIGRHPGVVQVTFRAPLDRLEKVGLLPFVQEQYGVA